jgi:hypothetical protein
LPRFSFSEVTSGDEMKGNSIGRRFSFRGGVFVALLQLSFLTSVLNINAAAAMAGFHQSSAEYQRIFDDSRLLECLNGHLMTSVRNDGHKFLIEAENGRVIRGSMRTIPLPKGVFGGRRFEISELKVVSGHADNVINPRDGGPTSATRLQDFKNLLTKFTSTHYNLFRASDIVKIELLGTDTFRIASNEAFDVYADIPFTPTMYTPPDDDRSSL